MPEGFNLVSEESIEKIEAGDLIGKHMNRQKIAESQYRMLAGKLEGRIAQTIAEQRSIN